MAKSSRNKSDERATGSAAAPASAGGKGVTSAPTAAATSAVSAAAASSGAAASNPSFEPAQWGDVLPPFILNTPWLAWLKRLSGEQRVVLGLAAFGALICVPWLGAVGFWDPWEVHYGEVAREMIARGDYLNPWWESAWFFSKPALDLWLMCAGMLVAGTNGAERWISEYTEWCVRLPFAAISLLGALLVFVAASRLLGRRPAVFGTVAIITSPLFVIFSRQAVPDPVFVGLLSATMACLAIVLFDHEPAHEAPAKPISSEREGWLAAFYVFAALGTLSKGILAFAIPGAVVLFYCVATGEWHRLKRLRLGMGFLLWLAICGPWYGHMFSFDGRDDEGKTFFERFIIHDHFKRLAVGVHTTTPGGTFTYFIEQLGFDVFPWVFAIPGAMTALGRARVKPGSRRERMEFFLLSWLLIGFAVFAFSVTKFHHYAFPVVAPLLLFAALWLERVLDEGLRAHAGELLAGTLLYGLVAHDLAMTPKNITDMFVYNYDRPYPHQQVDPRRTFDLLFFAAPAAALSPWLFDRLSGLWNVLRALVSKDARARLKQAVSERMAGQREAPPEAAQDRSVVVAALVGLAAAFAIYLGWFHWRELSPHWTQRDLFWTFAHEAGADEPIGAYQMNWRGETFYSKNTVRQVQRGAAPLTQLSEFMAGPGGRKWLLVEQGRLSALRQALPQGWKLRTVESHNNKFALTVAEPVSSAPQQQAPLVRPNENGVIPVQRGGGSGGVPEAPQPTQSPQGAPP
ncbi:MAG: glycosyltransferase family 39 protein [Deltaproteobacteria bacterium]|nr:glycosyltransferase family 39 protein [Deltaproteobacteria bacterium]